MTGVLLRDLVMDTMIMGTLVIEGHKLFTLERPWRNNQHRVSCIPAGTYTVRPFSSPRHKDCFELVDVPDRDAILIHAGNFVHDTEGCILVGRARGNRCIVQSRLALDDVGAIVGDNPWTIEIRGA